MASNRLCKATIQARMVGVFQDDQADKMATVKKNPNPSKFFMVSIAYLPMLVKIGQPITASNVTMNGMK